MPEEIFMGKSGVSFLPGTKNQFLSKNDKLMKKSTREIPIPLSSCNYLLQGSSY